MDKIKDLIHIGVFRRGKEEMRYLFLRKIDPMQFRWFESSTCTGDEADTELSAENHEEAIRLAFKKWKENGLRLLNCGFRYTLPERDEHGINALFFQMRASYTSSNGVYFDTDLGNNCFVQNASLEALAIMKSLHKQG